MMCNTGGPFSLATKAWYTQTLIAMSITVREEQNSITSSCKMICFSGEIKWLDWNMKHEKKSFKVLAQLGLCTAPQPYWWLPQPKFCSPGWFAVRAVCPNLPLPTAMSKWHCRSAQAQAEMDQFTSLQLSLQSFRLGSNWTWKRVRQQIK